MLRTISLVLALSFIGAVAAIELRTVLKSKSCEPTQSLVEASLLPPPQRPKPRPVAFATTVAATVTDRPMPRPIPLSEWAEAINLGLRHSLRF